MRSGNESDIAPSPFELTLRHLLTHVLSVRPRFKEFLIGFPAMMLLPALLSRHRRAVGWLLALAIGVGIGDVIDTFSHLHTPLSISLLRIVNGLIVGGIIGAAAIAVYRRVALAYRALSSSGVTVRVLLSGYYGFGNLGDEALLEVIAGQVRRRFPQVALEVLSATPRTTAARYGVAATPRWDWRAVRAAVGRADVVLSGGGGLLQNATSLRSLLYYAGIVREAARKRHKTMVFAQSIGPLDFWGRLIVGQFCKGLDRATVRDERSRALLQSILPETPVERTADPVFLYDLPEGGVDLAAEGLGPESGPYAVVSVRRLRLAARRARASSRAPSTG